MQAAVVHDGGVGKDPPRRQKRLPFKSAPATWIEATRAPGCDAESEWKALPSEEQRAIKAVADAAAKHQENVGQSLQKRGVSTRPTSVAAATREHSVRHGTAPTQRAPTVAAGRHLERWTRRMPLARDARCAVHGCAVHGLPRGRARQVRHVVVGGVGRAPRRLPDVRHCAPS